MERYERTSLSDYGIYGGCIAIEVITLMTEENLVGQNDQEVALSFGECKCRVQ